ncbi:uncharacterized protein H6S33_000250 [Morchella sextelata]|uniref:uncharacterized protein n=1 Tax=Morchella sextelata TaxID=1174677 RepID=UPI001D04EB03|nr:uncharacterized protein H6S33_000250 [Morchella sextelata]KAH0614614.1 hypothetical protein H6S33_000250 [Morchella sextelata]
MVRHHRERLYSSENYKLFWEKGLGLKKNPLSKAPTRIYQGYLLTIHGLWFTDPSAGLLACKGKWSRGLLFWPPNSCSISFPTELFCGLCAHKRGYNHSLGGTHKNH